MAKGGKQPGAGRPKGKRNTTTGVNPARRSGGKRSHRTIASDAKVMEAIEKGFRATGTIRAALESIRVSWSKFDRLRQDYPAFRETLGEIQLANSEAVESVLFQRALAGEPWAVRFFLQANSPKYRKVAATPENHTHMNVDNRTVVVAASGAGGILDVMMARIAQLEEERRPVAERIRGPE